MLRADVRVGRREPRLILIDIRRVPGICQLLRRTTCFGVQVRREVTRVERGSKYNLCREYAELTDRADYSSVTAPLSFSTVIKSYTAFEMLGQSHRLSAPNGRTVLRSCDTSLDPPASRQMGRARYGGRE